FDVGIRLRQDTLDRRREIAPVVVARDDDADPGRSSAGVPLRGGVLVTGRHGATRRRVAASTHRVRRGPVCAAPSRDLRTGAGRNLYGAPVDVLIARNDLLDG